MTNWPLVRFRELLTKSEETIRLEPTETYRQVTVKLRGQGVVLRNTVTGDEIGSDRRWVVRSNQFLLSRIDARNGAVGLVPEALDGAVVSNDFPAFVIDTDRLEPRFLNWYSRTATFVEDCKAASEGTTNRVRLKADRLYDIKIPLPPIHEQRRIVERIERLQEKIQAARGLVTEVALATDTLWMTLARRVFDGIADRERTPLGEWVSVVGGGTPSKSNPEYWEGRIPWVSPKDMKSRMIRDSEDHISDAAIQRSSAKLLNPGAVLIVVRGMILAHTVPSAILCVPATINQDIKALVPKEGLDPEFLSRYLWAFNRELLALVKRSTHDTRKLETDKLLGFPLSVPMLDKQKTICGKLRILERREALLSEHRRNAQREAEALLPSVLDQAFNGQI